MQFYLAVGYSSGHLRVFSESGGPPLFSQPLHRRPLIKLSLRFLPRTALDDQEELIALFDDRKIAVIAGLDLMTALRVAESGDDVPLLGFRKAWMQGQEHVSDVISCGPSPNSFQPPLPGTAGNQAFTARYLAVGARPMLAYYCTSDREGFSLTNVASKVTSAIGSIASSFFGRRPQHYDTKHDPAAELASAPARPVPTQLFLSDAPRKLLSIVPSPKGDLVAISDNFGRVLVLDVDDGTVVRMYKGSRGAQVGWVEVTLDEPRTNPEPALSRKRAVLLLAIYLPRGVLELHRMRHGERIAQLAVPAGLRMLANAHGALVLNQGGFNRLENPASVFLVSALGEVRMVRVPVGALE